MRVGLFGGAFDPPHIGHLISAEYAIEKLALDTIIFIPSGDHPFKGEDVIASSQDRLAMVELATQRYDKFQVSELETEKDGPSYSIETIEYFHHKYPDWELYLLIGTDNVSDFNKWHRYSEILGLAQVSVVLRQRNANLDRLKERYEANFLFLDTPVIDVSSTEIRDRVRDGKRISYLVTHEVEEYIDRHKLYR